MSAERDTKTAEKLDAVRFEGKLRKQA